MKKWMIELRLKTHKENKSKLEKKKRNDDWCGIIDNLILADYSSRILELE